MARAWPEEKLERFKELHASGIPFSAIAADLGVTRNAVIGKAHRLGLYREIPRGGVSNQRKLENRGSISRALRDRIIQRKRYRPTSVAAMLELLAKYSKNPVKLMQLEPHHCRWPVSGEGLEMLFCGDPVEIDRPYCVHHCAVAYRSAHGVEIRHQLNDLDSKRLEEVPAFQGPSSPMDQTTSHAA